ncbi:MAG: hypothetical protein ACLPWS_10820 [Rhodomicrobium sp.]
MKTSKKCPKCQSRDIIRVSGEIGGYGSGNHIRFVNRLGYVRCELPWTGADQLLDYRYG